MRNYGYACINKTFSDRPKKQRITTNRTMIKRTFQEKGIGYASELALQNVRDLNKILEWNLENNIYFYRGHWVMTHHRPNLMWRWNHHRGQWVVVFRF